MRRITAPALLLLLSQTACVVGGYSSEGGVFLWPGSIVVTILLVLIFLFMWRRRR
jgi:ABC-type glucose/galactose transport system permease subunit